MVYAVHRGEYMADFSHPRMHLSPPQPCPCCRVAPIEFFIRTKRLSCPCCEVMKTIDCGSNILGRTPLLRLSLALLRLEPACRPYLARVFASVMGVSCDYGLPLFLRHRRVTDCLRASHASMAQKADLKNRELALECGINTQYLVARVVGDQRKEGERRQKFFTIPNDGATCTGQVHIPVRTAVCVRETLGSGEEWSGKSWKNRAWRGIELIDD